MIQSEDNSKNNNLDFTTSSKCIVNPPPSPTINMVPDSGASSNYLRPTDTACATNIIADTNGPTVTLPNNSTITADRIAQLPLSSKLSTKAQQAHVLPGLTNASLLSVGKLCDDDCDVIFRQHDMHVLKNKANVSTFLQHQHPILKGTRNYQN